MVSLITILRDVPKPRTGNATRHDLLDVLMIALVASICCCESCAEFADFAEDREELFRAFLGLECVFHAIMGTDFTGSWAGISRHRGHPF